MTTDSGTLPKWLRDSIFYLAGLLFAFVALSFVIATSGCSSATERVQTGTNGFHYIRTVYSEKCVTTPEAIAPAGCSDAYKSMSRLQKWVFESMDAVKRGGKFPLQLKAMDAAEADALKKLEGVK